MKKGWIGAIGLWVVALMPTTALAATTPQSLNVPGVNTSGTGPSLLGMIQTGITDVVLTAGAVGMAFVVYSLIRAGVLLGLGGHQAQRREDAKTHLIHAMIGGIVVGAAGIIVGALYSFGQSL